MIEGMILVVWILLAAAVAPFVFVGAIVALAAIVIGITEAVRDKRRKR